MEPPKRSGPHVFSDCEEDTNIPAESELLGWPPRQQKPTGGRPDSKVFSIKKTADEGR